MMAEQDATFSATVHKVQTLADGGLRLTLDLPETELGAALWMMTCKREEIPLKITARLDNKLINDNEHKRNATY